MLFSGFNGLQKKIELVLLKVSNIVRKIELEFFSDFIDFGAAECCGNVTVGSGEICCESGAFPREFGDDTACCGDAVIDLKTSICCAGLPRALDGISPDKAQCCGDACMDAGVFYCCEGRVYAKAEISHDDFDKMSCNIPLEEEEEGI